MLSLIYLGLAIALGDLLCRRFYWFVSVPHRWAAAILVGLLLSTWFTYLAWLAFAHTAETLLFADLLFFVVAPGAIFWLSRKAPIAGTIAPRAPGSSRWDWITLGALFAAAGVLLIGTLYVNKQGRLRLSATHTSDFAPQFAIAQSFAIGHNFPTESPHYGSEQTHYQFPFYFQAGNLEFLGLNLAWSIDVLSVLGLTSILALIMALGQLLFNSRVVGRGAAVLFFFAGWPPFIHFLTSKSPAHGAVHTAVHEFIDQRHLPFPIGILLLVLIFLIDQYRQRSPATAATCDANIALRESKGHDSSNELKTGFFPRFITSARRALRTTKSFGFSGLLLAALPLWNVHLLIAVAVVMCCLLVAYGFWWLSRLKTPHLLGPVLAGTLTACILAAGVIDVLTVYSSSRTEVNYEKEPLVKGLAFRTSVTYKIPESSPPPISRKDSSKPPVTAFQGGRGDGKGQFDIPRGLAIDGAGNIYVADTNNGRVEKFSPGGVFITSIGTRGKGPRQLGEPNGIAIDRSGNIYVADAGNHRVQKLAPDGRLIAEWSPALYGPRRIAIGPDDSIYVVDQGHARIVKFNLDGEVVATWGSGGTGDGQFRDPTSVAVDPTTNKVYVADPINSRIQVFDSNGKFLTKRSIPEWGQPIGFEDLAVDPDRGRLYASSANMNTILVFDLQGNRLGTVTPPPPDKLDGPSALALAKDKLFALNTASARVSVIPLPTR